MRKANVDLSVRAQQMTMVDGDLGYSGQFPLHLTSSTLTTDDKGIARFTLPAAKAPSRYVLTVFASDGAAYRVKTTKELLVERGHSAYRLQAASQFSAVGETVAFTIQPQGEADAPPDHWEWVRLEDRQKQHGELTEPNRLNLSLSQPGNYSISLRDAQGNLVAATSHFVSGAGIKAPSGSIAIVFDKSQYKPGETAQALLTFPVEVANALLTLERDKVEKSGLLNGSDDWLSLQRLTPTQWRMKLKVKDDYGPNITFSVAYVKNGDYVFQNQGIKVEQNRIQLDFKLAKPVYAPGEAVDVEVQASVAGKPVAATLAVGVVDEMIYVLQPEIAPDIFDFFYHPPRNNVRTNASLNFIGYDLSAPPRGKSPTRRQVNERAVKVLERPRRDEVDTAFWQPKLITDSTGRARFRFIMPDSLTRWRITGRAIDRDGVVGQRQAWLRSDKPVYLKWTSPNWLREKDSPQASLALFNQTSQEQSVELSVQGAGAEQKQSLKLVPGINFSALSLDGTTIRSPLRLTVRQGSRVLDSLEAPLQLQAQTWSSRRSLALELSGKSIPLTLPADARELRLRFVGNADALFARAADDLIDYPYGCVEQTASRLIPLSLVTAALKERDGPASLLRQRLYSQRFRLAQMAGPNAVFGWWGDMTTEDPFLTGYAYFADWQASRTLGLRLPQNHWDRLLDNYAKKGYQLPLLQRALSLHWMQEIGLPVGSMVEALAEDLNQHPKSAADRAKISDSDSLSLSAPASRQGVAAARVLTAYLLHKLGSRTVMDSSADSKLLKVGNKPFDHALLLFSGQKGGMSAEQILSATSPSQPTFERAMSLFWTYQSLAGRSPSDNEAPTPTAPWQKMVTASGQAAWVLPNQAILPKMLELNGAPGKLTAFIDYDSRSAENASLPLTLERRLYRLQQKSTQRQASRGETGGRAPPPTSDIVGFSNEFELQPLSRNAALHTNELYLDEIVLRPGGSQTLRYGLLEAALPPGATVERSTWGIRLRNDNGESSALEKARQEDTRYGYAVPIDALDKEVVVRHLLRFSQKGRFELPPARFHRMYQPEQKAFENRDKAWTQLHVK